MENIIDYETILSNADYHGDLDISFLKYIITKNIKPTKLKNIYGSLDFSNSIINELPELFSKLKIHGDFICKNSAMKSLKHFPNQIDGFIDVSFNPELENLAYFDLKSCGGINISFCGLTSLNGLPHTINGDCLLQGNKLTNLKDINVSINGSMDLSHNKIVSLEGFKCDIKGDLILVNNSLYEINENNDNIIVDGYINLRLNKGRLKLNNDKIIDNTKKDVSFLTPFLEVFNMFWKL
jgi:hypothetical protein